MGIIGVALYRLLDLLIFVIFVQCIMTWIPGATQTKLYDILSAITDPIEEPIRSVLYRYINSPLDFTPIIAFFIIRLAQRAVFIIF
ncbi:YggT family protein [Romboutsia ilealis]|uniref:YggT family protein n=1 Tax=Romboutsia faecis TaxID=2764597 RepID=A0ABR7JM29_9FIRM|nr:YggT family protein [Romboutsia faecis]MBC5995980.1 YggT family protein [Romboutsia faecis]MDU2196999.1 YggT family protein [Peptostreptococcaceae bacterium]MRN23180.1 YggT family protein [Romboutsia ilealis]